MLLHGVAAAVLQTLPPLDAAACAVRIEVRMDEKPPPPPDPEPDPPKPEPEKPKPPEIVHEIQDVKKTPKPASHNVKLVATAAKDAPPSDRAVESPDATAEPTFGISMESTSPGGGPAMPVGNTTQGVDAGPKEPDKVKPLAVPTAIAEVTKMPTMRGKCDGKYTDAAREASIEGTVVLDVTVDATGSARDIVVVKGLSHGLDESAIETLKRCQFAPGERNGKPVTVRIRAFKIRFYLDAE